jgi:hypothetical protein
LIFPATVSPPFAVVVLAPVVVVPVLDLLDPQPAAKASIEQASKTGMDLNPLFIDILSQRDLKLSLDERLTAVVGRST